MRSAPEAAKYYKDKGYNRVGMCLWETQRAFNVPTHMFPNAITQWYQSKHKHSGDRRPPIGAPVCFAGGNHGHIAIYVGNGLVRSSDAGGAGRMATVSIDWFRRHWGYTYLGWIGDIAGQKIDFDDKIHVYAHRLKPRVDNSDSVRMLRLALISRGFLKVNKPLSRKRPGNRYTAAVERAVANWQKRKGHTPTGVMSEKQVREFFTPNDRVVVHK